MSKVTKIDLNERLLLVETLLGLHRVLPEQISMDKANDAIFRIQWAVSRGKELAEREQKPQLNTLDQSVFDGLDKEWQYAAVDGCTGRAYTYEQQPHFFSNKDYWRTHEGLQHLIGAGYDTTNWRYSLIKREAEVELTGSDLCRAMLDRGDKYVMCYVSKISDTDAVHQQTPYLVFDFERNCAGLFDLMFDDDDWQYAVPINNQGEPLTAKEAGL